MSGGHFDYQQNVIHDIADEVETLIQTNDIDDKDEYGDVIGRHYSAETIAKFKQAAHTLRRAAAMAQRVDWLVCNDDGEDAFHRRWDKEVPA